MTNPVKPVVRIESWSVGEYDPPDPYKAPECQRRKALFGTVLDHPTHGRIEHARTSPIVKFDLAHRRIETVHSVYDLGEPQPDYLAYAMQCSAQKTRAALRAGGFVKEA